ncbi:MAG: PQQ-binding-like beta-propeller repeat protein [Planctomycetota bacterium]
MATLLLSAACASAHAQDSWTHAARTPQRVARAAVSELPSLGDPAWRYDAGGAFASLGQGSPVISRVGVAIVVGTLGGEAHAIALDVASGNERWHTPVPPPALDSWSSPAILDDLVVVASDRELLGLDLLTGHERWRTQLGGRVVNASPAILGQPARVFITTYDPFGGLAELVSINADPFDANANPFDPGEVVGRVSIGSASGATPAVDGLVVFAALVSPDFIDPRGAISAFVRGAQGAPVSPPLWSTPNAEEIGFFGGVSTSAGGLFAASYNFFGGRSNSNLVKLAASTGLPRWSTPAARSSSTPIPLPDGRIVLSGGLDGFGSLATVQLFQDLGSAAERIWDLVDDTWHDADGNGKIDPGEYIRLGGWDHQPAVITAAGRTALLVGVPADASDPFGGGNGLVLLDLDAHPGAPGFVLGASPFGGGSPAVGEGMAISIGRSGVTAFDAGGDCLADCDDSGTVDVFDYLCFQNTFDAGNLAADCDGSGSLDVFDILCFQVAFEGGCP